MNSPLKTIWGTYRALLQPKRAVPIALVSFPLLYAQWYFAQGQYVPMVVGFAMVLGFLFLAPASWRVLVPMGRPIGFLPVRVALYALFGALVVYLAGRALPVLLGMSFSFLTAPIETLFIEAALFWVGGWGLGRDIDLEENLVWQRQRAEAFKQQAEHAQVLAIKSHLDPHFLFNTLNAIAEWCREDGETAERAVLQLSQMLRTVLAGVERPWWPLADELDLVRTLFDLHLLRDPDLFSLDEQIDDDALNVSIPPMLLLPVAENAMKYGPASGHRGTVRLVISAPEKDRVRIEIDNPGAFTGRREGGHGLAMVERRLALAYGDDGAFSIVDAGERTRARIELPRVRTARSGKDAS